MACGIFRFGLQRLPLGICVEVCLGFSAAAGLRVEWVRAGALP